MIDGYALNMAKFKSKKKKKMLNILVSLAYDNNQWCLNGKSLRLFFSFGIIKFSWIEFR